MAGEQLVGWRQLVAAFKRSDVYKKLFNKDGERGQMDAFGQGYSNKGIGV